MRNVINDVEYHLIKRKNGKQTVYYAGFLDDLIGKNKHRKYKAVRSLKTGNKVLAQKRVAQLIADGSVFSSKSGLKDFLLDFWDPEKSEYLKGKAAEGQSMSTAYIANNHALLSRFVIPWFTARGITTIAKLTRPAILAWRNELFEKRGVDKEHSRPISTRTINTARQALYVPLSWACDMGLLPYHPGQGVKPVSDKPAERKIFTLEEYEKLFSVQWPDIRYKAACLISADTGMRAGEVRGLLIRNVRLDDGKLDVLTSYQDREGLKPPKWNSERLDVEISVPVVDAIRDVIALHRWGAEPDQFVFFGIESATVPIGKRALSNALFAAMKKAKIPGGRTFHSFRHSIVSHAAGRLSQAALRDIFGWTNTSTPKRYQHITEADRESLRDIRKQILPFKKAQ